MKHFLTTALCGAGLIATLASCSTPATGQREISLFNGRDLNGWKAFLKDGGQLASTFSVRDGCIVCTGEPMGYLYTDQEFTNFVLTVEYRWPPGKQPGNSGLFARVNGEPMPLPRTFECQLKHGNAGDLFGFHGMILAQEAGTNRFRHTAGNELTGELCTLSRITGAEQPPGEWNRVEYRVQGERLSVAFNGRLVNSARRATVCGGPIALQSEGGEIQFRKVTIRPIP